MSVTDKGFRIFFLGAVFFAVASMVLWLLLFLGRIPADAIPLPGYQWHAQQMIFGYVMAVAAGFLLTAGEQWTGRRTLEGWGLGLLFALWAGARLSMLPGVGQLAMAAALDALFSCGLVIAVALPVIRTRQWKQMALLSKVLILGLLNGCFYLGIAGVMENGVEVGILGGFYLVIGLIMTVARRVVPFFIERALPESPPPRNYRALDFSSLALFLGLFVTEVFLSHAGASIALGLALFAVNAARLVGWHVPGLWRKSMVWSLYLSQWFICLGFLMIAGYHWLGFSRSLAIHLQAVGGVGLVTAAMMTRVSLGHTGRAILKPGLPVVFAFILLVAATVIRALLPLVFPQGSVQWVLLSQAGWILGFATLLVIYLPILTRPRVDLAR